MITPLKKEKEKRKLWITSGESKGVNRLMAAVNLSFSFRTHQSWTHQREGREHLWNLNLGSARQSLLSCDQLFFFLSLLIYCWSLMDIHLFLIQILALVISFFPFPFFSFIIPRIWELFLFLSLFSYLWHSAIIFPMKLLTFQEFFYTLSRISSTGTYWLSSPILLIFKVIMVCLSRILSFSYSLLPITLWN